MGRIIDADSHFMEPLDLWQRYIEPKYRARALRFEPRPDSNRFMILTEENKRARFNVEDFLVDWGPLISLRFSVMPWRT